MVSIGMSCGKSVSIPIQICTESMYYLNDMKDPVSFHFGLKPIGSLCLKAATSRKDFLHTVCDGARE